MPPVQINPALQNRLRINSQLEQSVPSATGGLCVSPESQQLLKEFEEATAVDQNWDPRLAEATMFTCWSSGKGHKRKQPYGHRTGGSKALRRSSSPLLSIEEPKDLGTLKNHFDAWDALLDSALNGDLNLNEGGLLSPISREDDLTVHGIHISPLEAPAGTAESSVLIETQMSNHVDFDEETFLATEFLQSPWALDEAGTRPDFLCSSTDNLAQLFDLGDSLEVDLNCKIESLL